LSRCGIIAGIGIHRSRNPANPANKTSALRMPKIATKIGHPSSLSTVGMAGG
jgi:hypothetical protein